MLCIPDSDDEDLTSRAFEWLEDIKKFGRGRWRLSHGYASRCFSPRHPLEDSRVRSVRSSVPMLCSTAVGRWRREKYVCSTAVGRWRDTKQEQTSASNEVLMELDHLCALKGKDGIAQLLS